MEPPNDGCVSSFVETPVASIVPSTSKGKGRRKDSKGKDPKKQRERKDVVMKDIKSFFGGSAIVNRVAHLIQKKRK